MPSWVKKALGVASMGGGLLHIWFWEFIRAAIYDRVLHKLEGAADVIGAYVNADAVAHYGLSLAYVGLGSWLLMRARPAPIAVGSAARALAHKLDDFYAEGVRLRNAAMSANDADYKGHMDVLGEWSDRVVKELESPIISVSNKSRFRTLDRVDIGLARFDVSNPHMKHCVAVWNRKLDILRILIDSVGK